VTPVKLGAGIEALACGAYSRRGASQPMDAGTGNCTYDGCVPR